MRKIKIGAVIILILFIILPLINAQQVIEVPQPTSKPTSTFSFFSIFKSAYFWIVLVGILIFAGIVVGLFFLIRWLITFIKNRNDIFWRMKTERIKLSKIQSRYNSKHWWKVEKNTPVRLVKREDNKLIISQPIAYHRGDYTTHEGNFVLSINLKGHKKWFFIPITSLLIIPNQEAVDVLVKDKDGKAERQEINNLPKAKDIIQFNDSEILVYAESLSNTGLFYVPVLKSKDGRTIDLSLPVYESLRKVIIGDYLYEQTDEFTKIAKKSMDINPHARFIQKTSDNSQSVEIPTDKK